MRSLFTVFALSLVLTCAADAQDDKKPDSKSDQKKMQGTWTIEKFLREGKPFPEDRRKQILVIVKGNKMALKVGDREEAIEFTLDPSKKPPTIDFVGRLGKQEVKSFGIYSLEGDKLTILRVEEGGARPKSFKDTDREGVTLWEFKRKSK
jgi:uncharacterized protein (TIGR03067 family)